MSDTFEEEEEGGEELPPPLRFLILGSTDSGKSSLINALLPKDTLPEEKADIADIAATGRNGTTQFCCMYNCKRIGGRRIQIVDTVGIGTNTETADVGTLLGELTAMRGNPEQAPPPQSLFHGFIFCVKVTALADRYSAMMKEVGARVSSGE